MKGFGVGLYMIGKMMRNAGGKVEVRSADSVGLVFNVYFLAQGRVG